MTRVDEVERPSLWSRLRAFGRQVRRRLTSRASDRTSVAPRPHWTRQLPSSAARAASRGPVQPPPPPQRGGVAAAIRRTVRAGAEWARRTAHDRTAAPLTRAAARVTGAAYRGVQRFHDTVDRVAAGARELRRRPSLAAKAAGAVGGVAASLAGGLGTRALDPRSSERQTRSALVDAALTVIPVGKVAKIPGVENLVRSRLGNAASRDAAATGLRQLRESERVVRALERGGHRGPPVRPVDLLARTEKTVEGIERLAARGGGPAVERAAAVQFARHELPQHVRRTIDTMTGMGTPARLHDYDEVVPIGRVGELIDGKAAQGTPAPEWLTRAYREGKARGDATFDVSKSRPEVAVGLGRRGAPDPWAIELHRLADHHKGGVRPRTADGRPNPEAAADIVDAISSARTYKPAKSADEVRTIFRGMLERGEIDASDLSLFERAIEARFRSAVLR